MEIETAVAVRQLSSVVIRIAGDSGDGMQLTGSRLPLESAIFDNDLATRPDFRAEIRAPAGSLARQINDQVHLLAPEQAAQRLAAVIAGPDSWTVQQNKRSTS